MKLFSKAVTVLVGCFSLISFSPISATQVNFTSPAVGVVARSTIPTVSINKLPPEAKKTIYLIQKGGPFPYPKDGTVFGNFERRLPAQPRGYYREYTVPTPGVRHRGARRIVAGGQEFYYTGDHYKSFSRVKF